jgi:3-isopropylmalate dehydrogenase
MLLRYSLGLEKQAAIVETAVRRALDARDAGGLELRTRDLGGAVRTTEMGDQIAAVVRELAQA